MTHHFSSDAASRRENARQTDGKFGHQHHSEAEVSLSAGDSTSEQRRRLEIFADGHDDQWHQDFINHDVPALREVANYGWDVHDPYDMSKLNDQFKTINLHQFYDDQVDPYDAAHSNSGYTPQLWMSDKDGQSWAKVSDQDLLTQGRGEDAYDDYTNPEDFFDDDPENRHQPELNKYDYYGGDYDFVHAIPPTSVSDIQTAYNDPNSPLNTAHPDGETEVGLLPDKGPGEFSEGQMAVAHALHAKGVRTFVEYGSGNPLEDLDSPYRSPDAFESTVHFYRKDDDGNERHFATGWTSGQLADKEVYGAEVMSTVLHDVSYVENSYEQRDLDEWADELGIEYEVNDTSDPQYRQAAYEYNTITQQRRQLIDFLDDEDLVNRLAEES
ncbi:hypothetical protein [Enteractinococcus helveticum]|uniref:Uncharacterized protein n=1 Tax=Enteractinococcus helveticum TaxID=1837282 RepID=A0A1B7M2J6_9MICC|nr:hypothetical protein [Enteractinococcus helveticum]OAV62780.1 hypothetical protein A6F49_04550 [Enteractinococcus helveticum]